MKKHLSRLLSLLLALVLLIVPASALTVNQALELLENAYYYDIPDEAYRAKTLDELIQILGDPYTSYMNAEEYQAFLKALEGDENLVGIGVSIRYTEQGILILETISGGSAREAGFKAGDLIVEVDGTSCVPADSSSGDLIAGEEGTKVSVTILRDGVTSTHVLTRRPVIIPNTEIQILDGGIGYIDCNSFGLESGTEFANLVERNDSKVNVWVVDLRGNTGGYVDAAADMLSALMGSDRFVYFESGDGTVEYLPGTGSAATAKPVIVLTDGASASASELVASDIRDLGRGITVGGRTYGKGVAQITLTDESYPEYFNGDSLKVTVHRFYSAGLNTTDKIGVIPTLLVDDDKAADVALALCGDPKSRLSISVYSHTPDTEYGRRSYSVDIDTVDDGTIAALLSALPPQIKVGYSEVYWWYQDNYTPAQIAEMLGIEYENRWFTDVADSKYASAINAMGTYELLQGVGDGKFSPKSQLTRAQLCTMMARVLDVSYSGKSLFTDVDQDTWYGPSVNAMAYLGLVEGVGNGRFNPGGTLTQEQFLTIMGRAARFLNLGIDSYGQWLEEDGSLTPAQKSALAPYSDWAKDSVAVLAWGLEEALDDTWNQLGMLYAPLSELSPKTPILREEAAAGMFAVLSGLNILPREVI